MAFVLVCPCGTALYGRSDAAVLDEARAHLAEHGREYSDAEILSMAVAIPDHKLPEGF